MSATDVAPADDEAAIAIPKWQFNVALAGLLCVMAVSALDANIVGPALPRITSDLGHLSELSWVLTVFLLASTAATPVYGKLSDMYGRRPLVTTAVLIFLAGSAACGLAQTMPQLLAGRAIQGLGAGGLMTLTQITMSDLVSPRRRGSYQGLFGAVFTLANLGGAPLGGAITELWSWRWIFYVNVPIGLAALALIWAGLPPGQRSSTHRIDYAGILVVSAVSTCLLVALSLGTSLGWTSLPVLGLLAVAILLAIAIFPVERGQKEPLIPIGMVRNPVWLIATLVSCALTMAVFGSLAFLPLFLQLVIGLSPTMSGLVMAPTAAGLMLSLLVGGQIITKTGRYKTLAVAGVSIATLSLVALAWATHAGLGGGSMAALLLPVGVGLGLVMPGLTVALQNAVAPSDIGTATATSGFFRSLAGAFGVAAAGAIVAARLDAARPAGVQEGNMASLGLQQIAALAPDARALVVGHYQSAIFISFVVGAAVAAIGLLLILMLKEQVLSTKAGKDREAAALHV
ncbi:MDR family MFS transporter [Chelatococcus reniformis]|uniref:Major facilitator superfamily (MFS) profile domain-containing protein n=1 Tax=Chelatococcus reniformis TaxID=1494448 RepID=A0A916TZQ4_9HYPH|nr:MDR family MFS transporter [Chelatococcus reniformis]GGC48634.1 hypothetical protein GCM10010994_04770 [Chelatococcus reniformis]